MSYNCIYIRQVKNFLLGITQNNFSGQKWKIEQQK